METMKRLLALCDSPTTQTGFARVAQNLLSRWWMDPLQKGLNSTIQFHHKDGQILEGGPPVTGYFDAIDVWGIGYGGCPHKLPYDIYPASGPSDTNWAAPVHLERFLRLLCDGGYTHVWMLQDLFNFRGNFPAILKQVCDEKCIRSLLYFPVDAPVNEDWLAITKAVDVAVAYTEYGRNEVGRWKHKIRLGKIPHGVDTRIYKPFVETRDEMTQVRREALRGTFAKWLRPDDRLLLNVNTHSRRKGLVNTFEIVARLKADGLPVKLFMNMPRINQADSTDLETMAEQCGLKVGEDWLHNNANFTGGGTALLSEAQLCELYNCADLCLTTTYGEGWGLPSVEALACGCPSTFPAHTACAEIGNTLEGMGCNNVIHLPVSETGVVMPIDNNRVRYPVDAAKAAERINRFLTAGGDAVNKRNPLPEAARQWLDWDRIACEWAKLF